MAQKYKIELISLGETVEVNPGVPLKDVLFKFGVEFPCGGHARCRGCRVRVIKGSLPVDPDEEEFLTKEELDAGWRLACAADVNCDLTLELAQWGVCILSDERDFDFTPKEGLGVAVDLGTTTIVAQLIDLSTGRVLSVKTEVNPQTRYGSDIMTRIQHAQTQENQQELTRIIREAVGELVDKLTLPEEHSHKKLRDVVIAGNTVMHHLFCDFPVDVLGKYPFETENGGLKVFLAEELGWRQGDNPKVRFLPCIGGFVGSDLLAGIEAVGLHEKEELTLLVDLGTNGEIVLGNREKILCTSTAAGPAFEGGCISMGMRASMGAVSSVTVKDKQLSYSVIGNVRPCGVCGSGLVDAASAALDLHLMDLTGRLTKDADSLEICHPVKITQKDMRELQLAKGAIAAGVRILLKNMGAGPEDVTRIYLAGAFGNYVDRNSAQRIGMIRFPKDKIRSAGNTALLGAKMFLFMEKGFEHILKLTEHVSLSKDPEFQSIFVEEMLFPN